MIDANDGGNDTRMFLTAKDNKLPWLCMSVGSA